MKNILFLAVMAVMCTQTIDAQRKGGDRARKQPSPEQMVQKMDKKLNLTEEQEKQIIELYKDFFAQKYSREERKTKMQELETKINSLLTAEQQTAYKEMNAERKKK